MNKTGSDFTKGNLYKKFILYSLPFMLTNITQIIYPLIDMAVIGKTGGSETMNSISSAGQIYSLFTIIGTGFCAGGQIYISEAVGSSQKKELYNIACLIFISSTVLSFFVTVFSIVTRTATLEFIGISDDILEKADEYFRIICFSFVPIYAYNAAFAIMRGLGKSVQPFVVTAISLAVKLLSDFILASYNMLNPQNLGITTLVSNIIALAVTLLYFLKISKNAFSQSEKLCFKKEQLFSLLKLSVPLAMRSAAVNISRVFATKTVSGLDEQLRAAFAISIRAEETVNKLSQGVTYASSSVIGQNNSAGNSSRVKQAVQIAWTECTVIYAAIALLFIFSPQFVFKIFLKDSSVTAYASKFAAAMLISFPAMIISRGTNGYIQGTGKSGLCFLIAVLDGIIFRLGLCYLFGRVFSLGYFGYFLGYTVSAYAGAIPGLIYYKYKTKR